jgi:class 3 adenylate cyclase/tetratricopeptide (TPR) repeat protein
MSFFEVLARLTEILQREGRVSYRAIKREWQLDDASIEDLKAELIEVRQVAVDHDAKMLVWAGDATSTPRPATALVSAPKRTPLTFTPSHLTEKILASRAALEGERKQVTVLFADIKGSTELIEGLDPEEARKLLDPALQAMMEAVHRYEGTVNQVLGDGIMALFGAPLAHEDHALRACYAALAMQAAIRLAAEAVRRAHGVEVQIRVGLNSGEVVVRAIGNDLHMDYSAVGQTTHLAARMEQLAPPGSIRLTAETLRLVESLVQVNALGPVPVKGLTEPVEVFELVGASPIRQRLQATAARGLTRFVGRQHELEALYQALERAGAGHGQVVALVGEPGVGKSRLLYEFTRSHRTRGWLILESASVSYGKATAYFPVIDLLKRYFHVEDSDDPRTVRAKVTGQVLTLDEALQETIPAFLALLEVLPEESPFRALDPLQRRQRTLDALKRVLLRESQVQPLVLVFEDLHWIDTETQALLDGLVESLPTARILLLGNYRPEYQHGWGSKTYYMQLRLDPLPPASAEELLQALLGDDTSLQPLKQLLIARTGGNPFFLEESVRTLVETQVLVGERRSYHLAQALPSIQVPATVQTVIAARIDRLPPEEKRLLQTAAVIGTEVPLPLLQAIAEVPEEALRVGLAHLQAAEFLYETRLFPELEYTFKHALTHEVAYGSLLHERRRALHARIVEAIEGLYPDRLTEQVEWLAHHALRGEMWEKALTYSRQAGMKANARAANREAVAHFEQALVALRHLPERRERHEQTIDLCLSLRSPLFQLGELERMRDYLREAETLAAALDDHRRQGWVSVGMAHYCCYTGDQDRAMDLDQRALTIATAVGDRALRVDAHVRLAYAYHALGDYRRAIELLRQTVAAYEGDPIPQALDTSILPRFINAQNYLVWCLGEIGAFAEGIARGEALVRMAAEADHPFILINTSFGVSGLYLCKGDLVKAVPLLERCVGLSQAWNIQVPFPILASQLGWAYAWSGRIAEAMPLLEQAVERAAAMALSWCQSLRVAWLSEAHLLAGCIDEASTLARRALDLSLAHKERGNQAHVLRLLGEIAAHREPPEAEPAEDYYRQALTLADELGMRPLVAHCHHGLGTLYLKMGQREQACAELSAAIELYRAMEMTFWLPQADAALAQMEH